MLKSTSFVIFLLCYLSCACSNVDCDTGPLPLNIRLVDKSGIDPVSNGNLSLADIDFRPSASSESNGIFTLVNSVIAVPINGISNDYVLFVKQIPVDTFKVEILELPNNCCSTFTINDVKKDGLSLSFSPFLTINL